MIRVLWVVPEGTSWLGGVNYYRNLLLAVRALPDACIEPVICGDPDEWPAPLNTCKGFVWDAIFPRHSWRGFWWRVRRKLFGYDPGIEARMRAEGIKLLSHSRTRMCNFSGCIELCWIPDFQHIHLPEFFSEKERSGRSANFAHIAAHADGVILSSEDARKDFSTLFPEQAHKARVLSFVAPPPDMHNLPDTAEVLARYGINEPFIHIPNQLWIHKNHKVAIEALGLLRRTHGGKCPLIISTGHTEDYRHPEFFKQVQEMVAQEGVTDRFRFLGVVPYADLVVLMREAVCMLNPSLFEGWSTTVEEAKSMGKRLILSDIPVHIEQNPERGVYFAARDPQDLADKIDTVMASYDPQEELRAAAAAMTCLPERMADYGRRYQQIVLEALGETAR